MDAIQNPVARLIARIADAQLQKWSARVSALQNEFSKLNARVGAINHEIQSLDLERGLTAALELSENYKKSARILKALVRATKIAQKWQR